MIDDLKKYFEHLIVTKFRINNIQNIQLKQFVFRLYQENKDRFSNIAFFVNCLIKDVAFNKCQNCEKLLNQNQIRKRYLFCSPKCSANSAIVKRKRTETMLKIYGVENISQNEQIKNKKKKTCLQHYGVQFAIQNNEVKNKVKKTNLQRYGVEYCLQNEQLKNKMFETNLQRYGTTNPNQTELIKDKIKKANLSKYGVEYSSQNEQIKNKVKNSNLSKYGVQNISQINQVKLKKQQTFLKNHGVKCCLQSNEMIQKAKQTNLQRYGNEYCQSSEIVKQKIRKTNLKKHGAEYIRQSKTIMDDVLKDNYLKLVEKFKDYVVPMFNYNEYRGYQNNQVYKWKCVKCGNIFEQNIHSVRNDWINMKIPICRVCHPYVSGFSYLEKQVVDFVKSICEFQVIQNSRLIVSPYELDIYIPYKKLGIQFDGLIWHSNKFKKDDFNLLNKTQRCQKENIKLVHVFQDQWIYNKDFVKKMIKLNFEDNTNIYDYAEKIQDKYIFDRRYFSKLDFKNQQITYTQPQKFYIKNNQRVDRTQQNLYYIYDCGNLIFVKNY